MSLPFWCVTEEPPPPTPSTPKFMGLSEEAFVSEVILNRGDDFLGSAKGQHELLSTMLKRLEGLHKDMAKYFTFDPKKYSLEEFFGDLKAFKDGLQVL